MLLQRMLRGGRQLEAADAEEHADSCLPVTGVPSGCRDECALLQDLQAGEALPDPPLPHLQTVRLNALFLLSALANPVQVPQSATPVVSTVMVLYIEGGWHLNIEAWSVGVC